MKSGLKMALESILPFPEGHREQGGHRELISLQAIVGLKTL
jgi:hypothetical protein